MKNGRNLFKYTDYCDKISYWEPPDDYEASVTDVSHSETPVYTRVDLSENSIINMYYADDGGLDSIEFIEQNEYDSDIDYDNLHTDSNIQYVLYSDETNEEVRTYQIDTGTLPIALLNNGRSDLISYVGYLPDSVSHTAIDGNEYRFYWGIITIYVYGDFGNITVSSLNELHKSKHIFTYGGTRSYLPSEQIENDEEILSFPLFPSLSKGLPIEDLSVA